MTGIIKDAFRTPYSGGMEIHAGPAVLSVFVADSQAFFFDRTGRIFAAWEAGWFIRLGLSGRAVAHRWQGNRRQVRALKSAEILHLDEKSKRVLHAAYSTAEAG